MITKRLLLDRILGLELDIDNLNHDIMSLEKKIKKIEKAIKWTMMLTIIC